MSNLVSQAVVVEQDELRSGGVIQRIALFAEDGSSLDLMKRLSNLEKEVKALKRGSSQIKKLKAPVKKAAVKKTVAKKMPVKKTPAKKTKAKKART